MMKLFNKRNIFIFIMVFLVVIGGIGIAFYVNIKKHATVTREAIVTYVGNHYIVVTDDEMQDYSLRTDLEYQVGDRISFTMKDIKKDTYPKEGTVEKIDTISKSVKFNIIDSVPSEENTSEDDANLNKDVTVNEGLDSSNNVPSNDIIVDESKDTVVAYFEQLNANLDTYQSDKSLGEDIKSGFVTVVDFLFYNGTIKGKTFNELSTSAKLKVLQLVFSIDKKIEQHFPGYKEQISSTSSRIYTNIKTKAIESYLDITTKVCVDNADTCQAAKEGLSDLKTNFSLTWDFIKEISGIGFSKLKAWYEIWKEA